MAASAPHLRALLLCGLLGAALAGPISRDDSKCSTKCSSGSQKFQYQPEKTYVYSYMSQTSMGLTQDDSEEVQHGTKTEIKAKVQIHVKGSCEMVLKLSDVTLSGTKQDQSFKRALEANPLPFSFDDGDIRELCPTLQDQDKPFVLNTKRAILSTLKNTMKNLESPQQIREVDIAGDCLTKYSSEKGWNSLTVTKVKDLTSCRNRHNSPAAIFGTPYNVHESSLHNAPLLVGHLSCQQTVSGGLVKNVECQERNIFSPLSRSGKGAVVHTTAKLVFKEEKDGADTKKVSMGQPTDLLFRSSQLQASAPPDGSEARQVLQQLCSSARDGIKPRAPALVAKLVAQLRQLPYDIVARIYEDMDNKQICQSDIVRDIYVDALSMAGTAGPVKLMVKLVKEDKLSSLGRVSWLTSLAFNSHVDEAVISALLPLVKDYDVGGRQALLGVSSMVHGLCAHHQHHGDCEDLPAVKELIATLHKQLGNKCKTNNRQEEHRIRETLAAFENMGRTGDAEDLLTECFSSKENPLEVRHAAILAFRRAPCQEKVIRKMESLFEDESEEAPLRIYAYSGAMRCPDSQLIDVVTRTLEKEQVQQVGAYVLSHISNTKETSSPSKRSLRQLLDRVDLKQKFPSDPRKYSMYSEATTFSERLNAGAGYELSLVHSPKEFVPKFAVLNMSIYAMGSELNLVEVGAEMEGLTYLLEKYFGEQGYLSELSVGQLLKKLGLKEEEGDDDNRIDDNTEDEAADDQEDRKRNTRETKNGPLARMDLLHERMGVKTPNDPKVTAHLSILGRKIAMIHASDIKGLFELKEAFSIMELLTELAQKQKVERSASFQLPAVEVTLPAFSGLVIKLTAKATSVVAIQTDGKFDIRQLFTSDRGADIDMKICPSGGVTVSAKMTLDSGVHTTAMKVNATAHSSTCLELQALLKDQKIFDLKINLPKDKMEIISFKSDVYTVEADGQEKAVVPADYHKLDGCTQSLDKVLGLAVCHSMKAPKPLYDKNGPLLPISGPLQMEVTLQKTDKSLRGYALHVEVPGEHEYNELSYKVDLDTPGSTVDRHLALEAKLVRSNDEQTLNYRLTSPFKKLAGTASLLGKQDQKKARLSLTVDERDSYSVQGEVKTISSSGRTELQPSLEIHLPRGDPIILKGSLAYTAGKKDQLVIDLSCNTPQNNQPYLRGTFVKEGEFNTRNLDGRLKMSMDMTLSTPYLEARLHGTGDKQNTVYSSDLALTYKVPNKNQHNAKFIAKVQNLSTRHLTKFSTKTETTFSQLPEANTLVSWDFQHKPSEHLENDFKISNGPHYMDEEGELLHILQVSKMQGVEQNGRKGETENRLLMKLPGLENEVDLNVKTHWNVIEKPSFSFDADFKYEKDKHVQAAINYNYISFKPVEMKIEAKLSTPEHDFIYQDRVKERSPNEFEGKTMVQWARGKSASIDYVYRIKTDSSKVHHEVDLQLNSPLSRLPIQQKALLRVTSDGIDIRSHTRFEGRPLYVIDAKLSRSGLSKVEIQAAGLEGELEVHNEDRLISAKIQIKDKDGKWNYVGSTEYKRERSEKALEVRLAWNEKQDPSNQLSLSASMTKANPRSKIDVRAHYRKDTSLKIQAELDRYILSGTHDISVEVDAPQMRPVALIYHHEMEVQAARCRLRYLRNNVEQLEVRSYVKALLGKEIDLSAAMEFKSPKPQWDGKEFSVSYKHERRSANYAANLRAQYSPSKPYNLNLEYTTEPQGARKKIRTRAVLTTPHPKYRSQEALVVLDLSRSVTKLNADISNAENKLIRTELVMQGTLSKGSGNFKLVAPFKKFKSLKAGLELESGYTAQAFLEVNDDRMLEWDSKVEYKDRSTVDSTVSFRSSIGPKYDLKLHLFRDNAKKSLDFDLKKEDEDVFGTDLLLEREGKSHSARAVFKTPKVTWTLEAKNQKTGGQNQVFSISSRGLGRPVEVTLNWKQSRNEISPELNVCPGIHGSDCLNLQGLYKLDASAGNYHYEVGLKARDRPGQEITLNYLIRIHDQSFENNLHADIWGKEIGYKAIFDNKKDTASLRVQLPSRELQTQVHWEDADDKLKIQAEFLGDALRQPSKKLTLDISHESNSDRNGLSTHSIITINHPDLENPIKADVVAGLHDARGVKRPLELKADIEYSPDPKNKLSAEFYVERANNEETNTTYSLDIHAGDRDALEIVVQAYTGMDSQRITVGGNWKFAIPGQSWKGMDYLEIDKKNEQVHYYYHSPKQQYEIHTDWKSQPGESFALNTRYLEAGEEIGAQLVVDIPKSCFELTTHHQPDSKTARYHLCVDSQGNEMLSLTAESYADNEKVSDAKVLFERHDQKTFSAHIHWRPEKLGEILYQLMTLEDKLVSEQTLEEAILKGAKALRDAAEAIRGSILSPLADYLANGMTAIAEELASDFSHVRTVAVRIYKNLPEVREVMEPVSRAAAYLAQLVDDLVPDSAVKMVQCLFRTVEGWFRRFCGYGTVCYNLHYAYQRKGLEGLAEYFYGVFENLPQAYYKALVVTKDIILENLAIPSVDLEPLRKAVQNLADWAKDQLQPLLSSETVKIVQEKLVEYANKLKESWSEGVQAVKEDLDKQIQKLISIPQVKVAMDILQELIQEIQKEMEKLNLGKAAEQIESLAKDFLRPNAIANAVRVINLDPENGKIDIEVKMPKSPEEIRTLLLASNPFSSKDSEQDPEQERHPEQDRDQDEDEGFPAVVDVLNHANAALKQEWLPPFRGHAQLIGGQHFVTFDSTFYDFAGECSYLLARDFADGNFSVVVKYKGPGNKGAGSIQKSIIVVAGDKVIEIDPHQETVVVDDQEVEMPYTQGPVTVVRRGPTVLVDYKRGLSVTCHTVYDFCTTTISGWYHGKTAGLFGTYDHEPANDFLRPRGGQQAPQDPTAFARSWEVSSGCRFRPLTHEVQVQPDFYGHEVCRKAFADKDSPLRPCFQQMKADEYMKMCVRQVAIQGSANEGMCTVAAAFANVCRQKHYPVSIPSQCLKCQSKSSESIEYGLRRRLDQDQTPHADVVFVVEERQCNRAVVKELDGIARMMDRSLQDAGLVQNRFGLVAFGGRGRESPSHSHTARGKIFFEQKDLVLATEKMSFSRDSHGEDPDTFQALTEAIRYPFRLGVSKNLVLLTCSPCNQEAMSVSYPDIQNLLLQRGIVLHTLGKQSMSVRKSSTKGRIIYGMDAQKVYTSKDRKAEGDADLRSQVSYPKDVCVALAQEVGGSFFTTQPVTSGSPNESKNWKNILGKRVSQSAQPHPCQECECTVTEDDVPQPLCRPCRPHKPARPVSNDVSEEDDEY